MADQDATRDKVEEDTLYVAAVLILFVLYRICRSGQKRYQPFGEVSPELGANFNEPVSEASPSGEVSPELKDPLVESLVTQCSRGRSQSF